MIIMQYAEFECNGRVASIEVEPTGWGRPFRELHEKAGAGYVVWNLYSHEGFQNSFNQADVARHQERGYWAELFRDVVRGREKEMGETSPEADSIPVTYIAGSGLPSEIMLNTWLPKNGLIVPVRDDEKGYRFFKTGTLVPEKILSFSERAEAERIFVQFGLPAKELSGFYRDGDYRNKEYFAGRAFAPGFLDRSVLRHFG